MRLLDFIRKLGGEENVHVSGSGGGRGSVNQIHDLRASRASEEATGPADRPPEPRAPLLDPFEMLAREPDPAGQANLTLFPDVWLPPRRR